MSEWDVILQERKEDQLQQENARIINKMLQGKRAPDTDFVIRAMIEKYSKYGKGENERLLQELRFSKAVGTEEAEKG